MTLQLRRRGFWAIRGCSDAAKQASLSKDCYLRIADTVNMSVDSLSWSLSRAMGAAATQALHGGVLSVGRTAFMTHELLGCRQAGSAPGP